MTWRQVPGGDLSQHASATVVLVIVAAQKHGPYVDLLHFHAMADRLEDLDLTPRMADVIKVFLEEPSKPRYGFELMQETGLASGSLYPLLAKFEKARWLAVGKENIDPSAAGRPARRYYRISAAAVPAARCQLAALSARYRPPAAITPRLVREGGAR